jgi:beta-glucosidase
MKSDVALMKSLGIRAYRFSVSWSRVLPQGAGSVNEQGMAFYESLVDELLVAGITPWATLFHWDFPRDLQLQGGWLNRKSADWFADYAALVTDRLSDRVRHWMTINEPQIYIGLGHKDGTHAPGLRLPAADWLLAGHHTLLAHGRGVQAIRAHARQPVQVGWAVCGRVDYPATDSPDDIAAARSRMFAVAEPNAWNNSWWADPALLGRYPEDGLALFGKDAPTPHAGDMETIAQPLDYYGVNIYSGERYRMGAEGLPEHVDHPEGHAVTALRWPIAPSCLYWGPKLMHDRYKVPVIITENGLSSLDWVHADGRVHDPQRIDYTGTHLRELARAIRHGTDIRGYFHWSIMDNFEWAEGYKDRFGLIHVDYATQKRTPKDSAYWYRDVIESNGASLQPDRAASVQVVSGAKRVIAEAAQ